MRPLFFFNSFSDFFFKLGIFSKIVGILHLTIPKLISIVWKPINIVFFWIQINFRSNKILGEKKMLITSKKNYNSVKEAPAFCRSFLDNLHTWRLGGRGVEIQKKTWFSRFRTFGRKVILCPNFVWSKKIKFENIFGSEKIWH